MFSISHNTALEDVWSTQDVRWTDDAMQRGDVVQTFGATSGTKTLAYARTPGRHSMTARILRVFSTEAAAVAYQTDQATAAAAVGDRVYTVGADAWTLYNCEVITTRNRRGRVVDESLSITFSHAEEV